jgi:hypothetical protein
MDEGRGGYWVMQSNGTGPLTFVKFSDWSITPYRGKDWDDIGDQALVYIPPPYDCVVVFGHSRDGTGRKVRVCPIVADVPQGFTVVTTTGTEPTDYRSGGQWSSLLQCIVAYEAAGSYDVHKLTPPVGSLTAGTWMWSHETLIGAGGATPCRANQDNGANGRMIEAPLAKCLIWCDSMFGPVQAWRLTGMV